MLSFAPCMSFLLCPSPTLTVGESLSLYTGFFFFLFFFLFFLSTSMTEDRKAEPKGNKTHRANWLTKGEEMVHFEI